MASLPSQIPNGVLCFCLLSAKLTGKLQAHKAFKYVLAI